MSVTMQWHPTLPVLVTTYSGDLTSKQYAQMVDERYKLLSDREAPVIVLADMRDLGEVSATPAAPRDTPHLLHDPRVSYLLIVLKATLYRSLRRAIEETADQPLAVRFFRDPDSALTQAQALAGNSA